MAILKIAGLCVSAAIICASLKAGKPEIAMAVALAAGLLACALALDEAKAALAAVKSLVNRAGVMEGDAKVLLKAAGIALLSEYAAAVCRDAGESGLAQRAEFGARCALIALTMPVATRIISQLEALIA